MNIYEYDWVLDILQIVSKNNKDKWNLYSIEVEILRSITFVLMTKRRVPANAVFTAKESTALRLIASQKMTDCSSYNRLSEDKDWKMYTFFYCDVVFHIPRSPYHFWKMCNLSYIIYIYTCIHTWKTSSEKCMELKSTHSARKLLLAQAKCSADWICTILKWRCLLIPRNSSVL
jgi:hypothetical protein